MNQFEKLTKEILTYNTRKFCDTFDYPFDSHILADFEKDTSFLDALNKKIQKNNVFRTRNFNSIYQFFVYRNFLYFLVRTIKPQIIVETGVLHGLTSAWILKAISDNGTGKLLSIDLPRRDWEKYFPHTKYGPEGKQELDELPSDEDPGWVIPDDFRQHWQLHLGPSNLYLEDICRQNHIDFFIHDSDHSRAIMQQECDLVASNFPNAIMAVDNFDMNNYIPDLLHLNNLNYLLMDDVLSGGKVGYRTAILKSAPNIYLPPEKIDITKEKRKTLPGVHRSNRRWQKHLQTKGFESFIYDRLPMFCLSSPKNNPAFNFVAENHEENELARYWFNWMEDFPYHFYIEFSNYCNLKCSMCVNSRMTRSKGHMSNQLFKKIVDEIIDVRPFSSLHLYGIGEPLMDPGYAEKMDYICRQHPLPNQWFGTNGQLLLRNNAYQTLIDLNVPTIGIDVDAFTPETYQKIRVGGDFNNLINTVETAYRYLRQTGSKTRIELVYTLNPGLNDTEIDSFIEWCQANNYEYKIVRLHSWANTRDDLIETTANFTRKNPCAGLWSGFMIYWNGDVSTCFQDADGHQIFGNLNEQSITEIWQSTLREKRQEHIAAKFTHLCATCQSHADYELPAFNSSIYPNILRSQPDIKL